MTGMTGSGNSTAKEQDQRWADYVRGLRSNRLTPFDEHWNAYRDIFKGRDPRDGPPAAWVPDDATVARANLRGLKKLSGARTMAEIHRWSVDHRDSFWASAVAVLGIVFDQPSERVLDTEGGPHQPSWFPDARLNITDSCFTAPPDRVAIVSSREGDEAIDEVTYRDLERRVNRLANGLRERGFREGDAIALYLPMTVECVVAYLAVIRAGCIVVSIADSFSAEELARRMTIAKARAVITVSRFSRGGRTHDLYGRVRQAECPTAIVIDNADPAVALRDGDIPWDDLTDESSVFRSSTGTPDRASNVLFSSGTTGDPKAIPWTHLTPVKCAADAFYHLDVHHDDVVAWPTSIGWMMGPWLVYATLINGATMALFEGAPTGQEFASFVERAEVSILGVVPSLVRAWREVRSLEAVDWSGIRVFSSTGEPSNVQDYLWLMSRSGYRAPVIEYCGGTEIGGGYVTGSVIQPASPTIFSTPALGLDVRILDSAGKPVPAGDEGEVFLVPPSIGLSQRLLNRDHDEVYVTGCPESVDGSPLRRHGDRIARLHRGYFAAHGRTDDTMNLGGIKVSSLEIERVLDGFEGVRECAAVAVSPEGGGADRLVVFVVTQEHSDTNELRQSLQALLSQRLNPLFRIHDIVLVQSLPRTASNKLMRRALKDRYPTAE